MKVNYSQNTSHQKSPSFQHIIVSPKYGSLFDCPFVISDWKQELNVLTKFIEEFDSKEFKKVDVGSSGCLVKHMSTAGDTIEYSEAIPAVKNKHKIKSIKTVRVNYVDKNKKTTSTAHINTTNMSRDVREKFAEYLEKMGIKYGN